MKMGKKIAICSGAIVAIGAGAACLVAYGIQRDGAQMPKSVMKVRQSAPTANPQNATRPTNESTARNPRRDDRQADRQNADKPIQLRGRGRQSTQKFPLETGLCLMEISHDGQEDLVVRLRDEDGNEVDTVFEQSSPFTGSCGFAIEDEGMYLLDVEADGRWNAGIRQPRPTDAASAPRKLEGSGYQATPFVKLDGGLATFAMKHQGTERFKVRLMDRDGNTVAHIVDTVGPFEGSKPVALETEGIYFLNVAADGDWVIDVE